MNRPSLQMTVRTRAALVASTVVLVALVVGGVGLVVVVRSHLLDADRTAATLRARDVLALMAATPAPTRLSFPGEENGATQVIDGSGRIVAQTDNLEHRSPISVLRPDSGESDSQLATVPALDDNQRYVVVAVSSERAPHLTVLSATSIEAADETVATLQRALLIGMPVLVALVGVTTRVLVGRALRPVAAITAEVSDITSRGLGRRVPEPATADEIDELAITMNAMLERLEASSNRQRRFVADASHELRSPLASARTTLEVAALHPGTREDLLDAIGDALVDHDRLDHLTLDLLELAKLDDPRHVPATGRVEVGELVGPLVARRPEGWIDTDVRAAHVEVDPHLVTRVLTNLLDNAARHRRSRTSVGVDEVEGHLVVTVEDDGPGIPVEDRQRVLEPFTRLDEARVAGGGTGLGLAIVNDLVSDAGGTVAIGSGDLGGALVTVTL